jgi:hypothetical protein
MDSQEISRMQACDTRMREENDWLPRLSLDLVLKYFLISGRIRQSPRKIDPFKMDVMQNFDGVAVEN